MAKVQLRNQAGEFCNLEQYCADEPEAGFNWVEKPSPGEAVRYVDEFREEYIQLRRILEVADAFSLPTDCSVKPGGNVVRITRDGSLQCSWGGGVAHSYIIGLYKDKLREYERAADKWSATSYEVED